MNDTLTNIDRTFGKKCEDDVFDKIKKYFGDTVIRSTERYALYDFHNDDILIELKTRRNKKDAYLDTMIGMNKINYFLEQDKTCYSIFNFSDGMYYIEINRETIKEFRFSNGGRCDRGVMELKEYCFIPVNLLKEI